MSHWSLENLKIMIYHYTPGAKVITLIPYFPKSLAIGNVIPITAPLLAE